jgi:hypothetical protein
VPKAVLDFRFEVSLEPREDQSSRDFLEELLVLAEFQGALTADDSRIAHTPTTTRRIRMSLALVQRLGWVNDAGMEVIRPMLEKRGFELSAHFAAQYIAPSHTFIATGLPGEVEKVIQLFSVR